MKYERIIQSVLEHPWAILPSKLQAILAFLELQAGGEKLTQEEIMAATGGARKPDLNKDGDVGLIPILGTITHRMGSLEEISGGTSLQRFQNQLRSFVDDESVKAIVLDIDSPGGSTAGLAGAANEIYKARAKKPVIAQANTLMASAAYYLGSQATEVVADETGYVGSIGTIVVHADESKMWEEAGIKFTTITAGKNKALADELQPLEDEGRDYLQNIVDQAYEQFVKAVARGRDVTAGEVRSEAWGEGRVLTAKEAKQVGMIDRIGTMEETIARYQGRSKTSRVVAAPWEMTRAKLRLASRKNSDLTRKENSA